MTRCFIDNKTILTPTSGFLADGFTHTINAYSGCAFAKTLCGIFCYAQHNRWITKGRPWEFYGAKHNVAELYRREYDRIKRSPRRGSQALRIYMSSSTDPYLPQEASLQLTRTLLGEMLDRTSDALVIQTHALLICRDRALIKALSQKCELWVSITVETDMEQISGFPPHASSPAKRLAVLKEFREMGVLTQATISPLLPIENLTSFAEHLDEACTRVIVDHYLLGDGSPNGLRTKRTNFVSLLKQAGYDEWTKIDKLWEIRDHLSKTLGGDRVLVSREGFNAVRGEYTAKQSSLYS